MRDDSSKIGIINFQCASFSENFRKMYHVQTQIKIEIPLMCIRNIYSLKKSYFMFIWNCIIIKIDNTHEYLGVIHK